MPQPAAGLRDRVERVSAPALLWFSARPKVLLPVLTVVLLITGLAGPPRVGVPVLALLVLLIGWLTYLSWPAVETAPRVLRLATIGLLLVAAGGRVSG